ncbi:MAG: DoxX family protein [Deltaproteobacteria bacterium]|nr:DoxX family protein [Deltaproteobacteria bacterium]
MHLALCYVLGVVMTFAGALHFLQPKGYVRIMPAAIPYKLALVYISGVAESAGGLGLLFPQTRFWAGWWLVATFVAIFPANVNMAINKLPLGKWQMSDWMLWARLPLQAVFIAWAWWCTRV